MFRDCDWMNCICPAMTFTVDWALNSQFSSCCYTAHHDLPSLILYGIVTAVLSCFA